MTAPADPPDAAAAALRPLRIALVGASIGRAWQLDGFAARTGRSDVVVEYVGDYRFDKSASIAALCARTHDRPDAVILKECGTYFPGDQSAYEALVRNWVEALRAAGIRPVVATVAPVAAPAGIVASLKAFVKRWILRREDQNEAIDRFNAWLSGYAAEEQLPVLDLHGALALPAPGAGLDPAYDSGDGLHLNAAAYSRLDRALSLAIDTLKSHTPAPGRE